MIGIEKVQSAEQNNMQIETPELRLWGELAKTLQRVCVLEMRLAKLEAPRDQQAAQIAMNWQAAQTAMKSQAAQTAMKSQAAQQQAQGLYAPLRSDTKPLIDLAAFARRLLNPDDLGHAVTKEVRDSARRALGLPEVREYDL